jgi:UDP-N-acetylglucosamine/UDP-N-acetylgalactosamine 4-epimerase
MSSEKKSRKRIVLTGGAGFIGSAIAFQLVEKQYDVVVMDNLLTGNYENIRELSERNQIQFVHGDIRDYGTCATVMDGADVVLHQAALGSVPRSIAQPLNTHSINIDGFVNVLEAARVAGVKRFIYASSSSVYGNDTSSPKSESVVGDPLSPYALTKSVNEQYARLYAGLYGMEIIGLRYFNVFGPRQNPEGVYAAVIPLFITQMLAGKTPVIYGDGHTTRDFTFVDNVVQANMQALSIEHLPAGVEPVFNIACGATTSLLDLYALVARATGFNQPPVFLPERKGDIRQSFASVQAAEQYLNYTASVSLEEGIIRTVNWYRAQLNKD